MINHCPHCTGIQSGHKSQCPLCGKWLAFHLPTQSEVRAACAAIRAKWPDCKLKQQERWQELEIPRARKIHDGMRRRDAEDGRET